MSPDVKTVGRRVFTDHLVSFAHQAHRYLARRQIDLGVEHPLVADEIFFFDADRWDEKCDACAADIDCITENAISTCGFESAFTQLML